MFSIITQALLENLVYKYTTDYRPWWPSGLNRRSNSSRVAAEDPGLNPAWGMYMVLYWTHYIALKNHSQEVGNT